MRTHGFVNEALQRSVKDIELLWNNLQAFLTFSPAVLQTLVRKQTIEGVLTKHLRSNILTGPLTLMLKIVLFFACLGSSFRKWGPSYADHVHTSIHPSGCHLVNMTTALILHQASSNLYHTLLASCRRFTFGRNPLNSLFYTNIMNLLYAHTLFVLTLI